MIIMEEVDKIIIQSLREIGCDVDEKVVSLKQFTAELVVEAAVRCLTVIQPGFGFSPTLPPSMSARYKLGTVIAEACTDLGYTGEIGYQTFLYSSEVDVRRVFMFLVEKLPKELDKASSQPEEVSTSLRQRFREALQEQLSLTQSASSTSPRYSFVSVPLETGISLPGQKRDCTPQEWREFCVHRLPFLHEQVAQRCQLLPSIISHHTLSCLGLNTTPTAPLPPSSSPQAEAPPPLNSWMKIASTLLYTRESKKREKKSEREEESPAEADAVLEKKVEDEQEAIELLRERMEQLNMDIKTVATKLTQVVSEKQKQEEVYKEKKHESDMRQKTLDLLPDSAANTNKLQELIDEQARNLLRLGAQWEKHRVPLVDRYREARRRQSNKATESARQMETARDTRERLREMREELASKEALQNRLQEEYNKLSKTASRSAYTRRILEIIGNIKKQKEEIDKIVEDTKQLQREINIVSDRVDRSFTYADEIIFRDCKQDNTSRKIYKLLMQLHADCRQVVAMIEETGSIVREIRDLEEQIEVERAKDTGSKLERISADLRQMKQETASLRAQLARANTATSGLS